jgi:hypothetical protein
VSSTPSGHAIDENGFRKCKAEDTRPVISACPEVDRLASIQRGKGAITFKPGHRKNFPEQLIKT